MIQSPTPASPPGAGITTVFSPRTSLDLVDWYARQAGRAKKSFFMTAAFGVHDKIANAIAPESNVLRYLVLEEPPGRGDVRFDIDHDVKTAIGSFLRSDILDRWTREHLTGLNRHVLYSHTKYMLVDPLSDDPFVITGSGNFSDASVNKNDENMLVIQGDARVADIYLGEFMRIFNHFYFPTFNRSLATPTVSSPHTLRSTTAGRSATTTGPRPVTGNDSFSGSKSEMAPHGVAHIRCRAACDGT